MIVKLLTGSSIEFYPELERNVSEVIGHKVTAADLETFLEENVYQFDDMFGAHGCLWLGYDSQYHCNQSWFSPVYTDYGKCFTFNYGEAVRKFKQDASGSGHGLYLFLNIQEGEYSG